MKSYFQDQKCEYYKGIDLLKFIFSFFVVAIHVAPFSSINSLVNYGIQNYLARLAVPFYFVSSGFFLFNKIDKNGDKNEALRYAKRIMKLYLIWTIVYFPFKLNDMLHSTNGLGTEIILWIRNCLFTGSYIHLWYLNALAFSVVMVYLLVYLFKFSIEKVIKIGGGGLYFIGLLGQSYFGLLLPFKEVHLVWDFLTVIQNIIVTTRNGLFEGILFVGIGAWFSRISVNHKAKHDIIIYFFLAVSMLAFFIETIVVRMLGIARHHDMYLFLPICVCLLFSIALKVPLSGKKETYKELRIMGELVFFTHIIFNQLIGYYEQFTNKDINSIVRYTFVIAMSLIISKLILFLGKKQSLKCLRELY